MSMEYIIGASVSTDDVYQRDGTFMSHVPGGAGFYALCGMRIFTKDVIITGGVGPSYLSMHGSWYSRNGISTEALDPRCIDSVTVVDYRESEDRTDTPSIGLWEFRKCDPSINEILPYADAGTKGIYAFRHLDVPFLEGLISIGKKHGTKILWEISEDACTPENRAEIERLAGEVDVFSINRHELSLLYQTDDEEEALQRLVPVIRNAAFVRRGKDGAAVVDGGDGSVIYTKPCRKRAAIDTTGCGNASSAAFLYGYAEGKSLRECADMGAVAASYILAQFGPPLEITDEMMKEAAEEAAAMGGEA